MGRSFKAERRCIRTKHVWILSEARYAANNWMQWIQIAMSSIHSECNVVCTGQSSVIEIKHEFQLVHLGHLELGCSQESCKQSRNRKTKGRQSGKREIGVESLFRVKVVANTFRCNRFYNGSLSREGVYHTIPAVYMPEKESFCAAMKHTFSSRAVHTRTKSQ